MAQLVTLRLAALPTVNAIAPRPVAYRNTGSSSTPRRLGPGPHPRRHGLHRRPRRSPGHSARSCHRRRQALHRHPRPRRPPRLLTDAGPRPGPTGHTERRLFLLTWLVGWMVRWAQIVHYGATYDPLRDRRAVSLLFPDPRASEWLCSCRFQVVSRSPMGSRLSCADTWSMSGERDENSNVTGTRLRLRAMTLTPLAGTPTLRGKTSTSAFTTWAAGHRWLGRLSAGMSMNWRRSTRDPHVPVRRQFPQQLRAGDSVYFQRFKRALPAKPNRRHKTDSRSHGND
jgi:hypothetical protein